MKSKIILISIIILFAVINCSDENINNPIELNELSGIWEEEYDYNSSPWNDVVGLEIGDNNLKSRTVIKFEDNFVTVLTLPRISMYLVKNDSLIRGSLADTLYKGTYEIKKDTILMKLKGMSNQENIFYKNEDYQTFKYSYSIIDEALKIKVVLPYVEEGYAFISYSSFLWGYSYDKRNGKLHKK